MWNNVYANSTTQHIYVILFLLPLELQIIVFYEIVIYHGQFFDIIKYFNSLFLKLL